MSNCGQLSASGESLARGRKRRPGICGHCGQSGQPFSVRPAHQHNCTTVCHILAIITLFPWFYVIVYSQIPNSHFSQEYQGRAVGISTAAPPPTFRPHLPITQDRPQRFTFIRQKVFDNASPACYAHRRPQWRINNGHYLLHFDRLRGRRARAAAR